MLDEAGARRAPRLHLHRRHHHRDAQGRRRGADSGGRRARADLRRQRPDREGADAPTRSAAQRRRRRPPSAAELKPGQTRKETEGVFVVRDGKAEFVPIKMGIAGDKYFEVLSGLKAGDQVITGPYNSVRGMADGDLVKVDNERRRSRQTADEQVLRVGDDRARRHLVGQAAVVHDRARQHRRGDVDHRRGVADSGAERVGQGRRSSTRRAPTRSTSSSSRSRAATRSSTRSAATRASRCSDVRAVRRYSELVSAVMARLERRRPHHLPRQVDRQHAASRASPATTSTSPATTPSAAG